MSSGLTIDRISGNELRGRVSGTYAGPPSIRITENQRILADITATATGEPESWEFRWDLPVALYDRTQHTLHLSCGDLGTAIGFVGDPALVVRGSEDSAARLGAVPPATPLPAAMSALGSQTKTLLQLLDGRAAANGRVARRGAIDVAERYGATLTDACVKPRAGRDFVWLGVINYAFRVQRPQHLVEGIADAGNRVFYISINFEPSDDAGRFRIENMPHHGVFLLKLRVDGQPPKNIYGGFTEAQLADIQRSLDEALLLLNVTEPVVVVQYPSWYRVAMGIAGATVVHDCLDYVGGFSNVPQHMIELERSLIANADLVVTTAQPLAEHVQEIRDCVVIRNAADVDFFAQAASFNAKRSRKARPIVGYFGAIAEWYEVSWIEQCARRRPEWDFVLIGQTVGANVEALQELPNVKLLDERPYATLPEHLRTFDVAVIPFHLNELIRCTNPVKLYEYMAAGKPVVASPMPEVVNATPLVYIAEDAEEFEAQIERALREDSPALRRARHEWAREHTWDNRSAAFLAALEGCSPRVSVVILAYNNWAFTQACLHSVLTLSEYPNLEVIVVDNASSDETPRELERVARRDARVRMIRNESNLGFAGGNNAGIKASSGEYLILLNNDTYVTKGWVRDLIRPLVQRRRVGLVGPLTNSIGNEQKLDIHYADMQGMALASRTVSRKFLRECFETDNLAFFCVATRRDVIERVGLLDEAFGRGFFEDDDYCMRVREAGYRIVIADDVFVHHHLSASFNALGSEEKEAQMQRNLAIFEERWGTWKPHAYRAAPGFGGA